MLKQMRVPSLNQFAKILTTIPDRYRGALVDMFAGKKLGDVCRERKIPNITMQVNCWRVTRAVLGVAIPPKRLQGLYLLRLILSSRDVSGFSASSVRYAKLQSFDLRQGSKAKQQFRALIPAHPPKPT